MKSLEPYPKKLCADTWFYAKRCFAGLIELMSKNMIIIKDNVYHEILAFLDGVEQ